MMKAIITTVLLLICLIFFAIASNAQEFDISNDGQYVFAELYRSTQEQNRVFAVRSTSGSWYEELGDIRDVQFATNGKKICYLKDNILFTLNLVDKKLDSISLVSNYTLGGIDKSILIYKKINDNKLYIKYLINGDMIFVPNSLNYFMNPDCKILFAQVNGNVAKILRVDLGNRTIQSIWSSKGERIAFHTFSDDGQKLAFVSVTENKPSIWVYDIEKSTTKCLIDAFSNEIKNTFKLTIPSKRGMLQFTPNGKSLLFYVSKTREFPKNPFRQDIDDLHSYLDAKSNFYQKMDTQNRVNHMVCMNLLSNKLTFIESDNEFVGGSPYLSFNKLTPQISNDYALLYSFEKEAIRYNGWMGGISVGYTMSEFNFNKYVQPNIFLVRLVDGKRTLIRENVRVTSSNLPFYVITPDGKDVLYFDTEKQYYFCYNIATSLTRKVSDGMKICYDTQFEQASTSSGLPNKYYGLSEVWWLSGKEEFLTVDGYGDIWKLTLNGQKSVNITNGLAKSEGLSFGISQEGMKNNVIDCKKTITLQTSTKSYLKYPGIYELMLTEQPKLKKILSPGGDYAINYKVSKDLTLKIWRKLNHNTVPTIFYGKTFEDGHPVLKRKPNATPVKQELIVWNDEKDGKHEGLILFPKDFDSTKMYPVLVNYYTHINVGGEDKYLDYSVFKSEIDLGYILFVPAMKYEVGNTCKTVTNIIVSGIQELIKRPYINQKKIGIFGGSFSGYETNCIVSQTNIFTAAYSTAGHANLVSGVGIESIDDEQLNYSSFIINGQINMGVTLWERPDLYLANSPVFYADRVSCPILLNHGRQDNRVPFQHTVEFYNALKLNGKKVWMDAPDAGHNGAPLGAVVNYQKARQFFGHYLKDDPAPYWMTRSTSEILEKGLNPYDYDTDIRTPGDNILPKEKTYAPQVMELLKNRTIIGKDGRIVNQNN